MLLLCVKNVSPNLSIPITVNGDMLRVCGCGGMLVTHSQQIVGGFSVGVTPKPSETAGHITAPVSAAGAGCHKFADDSAGRSFDVSRW